MKIKSEPAEKKSRGTVGVGVRFRYIRPLRLVSFGRRRPECVRNIFLYRALHFIPILITAQVRSISGSCCYLKMSVQIYFLSIFFTWLRMKEQENNKQR